MGQPSGGQVCAFLRPRGGAWHVPFDMAGTGLERQAAAVFGCGVRLAGNGDVRTGHPFHFVYRDVGLSPGGTLLAGGGRQPRKRDVRQTPTVDRGGAVWTCAGVYVNLRLPIWGSQTSQGRLGFGRAHAL